MASCLRVFVENEAGANIKNVHDERTLQYLRSVQVARRYPFPYGFLLDTLNDDGDNLDCYILTRRPLRRGEIIECQPIGLMEQMEAGEQDHNVLAVPSGEPLELTEEVCQELRQFVLHVFDNLEGRSVAVGRFLGVGAAWALVARCAEAAARG